MNANIVITCARETTAILKKEVEQLGYKVEKEGRYDIKMKGSLEDCIRLNMYLRTAHRILWQVGGFKAKNPDQLYKAVKSINWGKYLNPDHHLAVTSFVVNEHIKDTRFANLKTKDAIVDHMKAKYNVRPNTGSDKSQAVVFLHWINENAAIYLDTSGETIAKHNYRKIPYKAPLMESLASAIILASGWTPDKHFINPMCGSGTLAIEAALIGSNVAPGLSRKNYAFMYYKGYDHNIWKKLRVEAHNQIKEDFKGRIIASDHSKQAVDATRSNARTAGVLDLVKIELCDFSRTSIPDGDGLVIVNPPYGERIGEIEALAGLYTNIGDFFKQKASGKTGFIFTGNMDLAKKVGLRTSRRIPFYNAKIECRLLAYDLYSGTRKN